MIVVLVALHEAAVEPFRCRPLGRLPLHIKAIK